MAATGKFIHNSVHTGLTIALTNAYVAGAQRHNLPLNQDMVGSLGNKAGVARLSALWIRVDTIAAGCTQLTVRLTRDLAGNQAWVGDTTATISTGITTATEGCVLIKIDVDYKHLADANVVLHAKTNAASCNIKAIELTWEE
jgi:hypothetical protein